MMAHIRRGSFDPPKIKKQKGIIQDKNNSGTIRSTYLEERAKEAAQLGNLQEERKIHIILKNEKSKERAKRLRFIRTKQKGAGVSRLTIETNQSD